MFITLVPVLQLMHTNMKWMNLPTGEVIVAPQEDSLEGKLVFD